MKELSEYTPIELNKMLIDVKAAHEALKKELIDHTDELDELQNKINEKIASLDEAEKLYVALIEEISKR
jgi:septal ring factor EnvC (AmiA/AmiB activator)